MAVNPEFGMHVRRIREFLKEKDRRFSLRQVALRVGIEPSYLSKIERGFNAPLSEPRIVALAKDLKHDPDILVAMAGKIPADVRAIILSNPRVYIDVIRCLDKLGSVYTDQLLTKLFRDSEKNRKS